MLIFGRGGYSQVTLCTVLRWVRYSHEQNAIVGVDVRRQPVLPQLGHEVLNQVRHLLGYPLLHADHLPNEQRCDRWNG